MNEGERVLLGRSLAIQSLVWKGNACEDKWRQPYAKILARSSPHYGAVSSSVFADDTK